MERTITGQSSTLADYFFRKGSVQVLGIVRICIAFITVYLLKKRYGDWSIMIATNGPVDALHQPSALIDLLSLPFPLPVELQGLFAGLFYLSGICAVIGLCTRPALVIFGILSIHGGDVEASRGFFNHETSLTTQVLLILALVPGSTSFSIDRLLLWLISKFKKRGKKLSEVLIGKPRPIWGIQVILIILACTYMTAGISKLRYGGVTWMDGSTLTYYLDGSASPYTPGDKPMFLGPNDVPANKKWKDGFGIYSYSFGNRMGNTTRMKIGKTISSSRWLIMAISVSTLLFELCGFLLLIPGWARTIYLFGAIGMHATIGVLMGLPFLSYQILCLCLIDWRWLFNKLRINFLLKLLFSSNNKIGQKAI